MTARTSRRSYNLPAGGGPSRRVCPSQCRSSILGMDRKMIQARLEMVPGVKESIPIAHLCPHHRERVLKALKVPLCRPKNTAHHRSLLLVSHEMRRRGSPKARSKIPKVCKVCFEMCGIARLFLALLPRLKFIASLQRSLMSLQVEESLKEDFQTLGKYPNQALLYV